eukprot:778219-Prymnesium_polylepis.1
MGGARVSDLPCVSHLLSVFTPDLAPTSTPRYSPRYAAVRRGTPRYAAVLRGTPRYSAVLRGTPRTTLHGTPHGTPRHGVWLYSQLLCDFGYSGDTVLRLLWLLPLPYS